MAKTQIKREKGKDERDKHKASVLAAILAFYTTPKRKTPTYRKRTKVFRHK